MHKFIDNIVAFSLKNKFFIFFCTAIAVIAGAVSFKHTPIDAFLSKATNTPSTITTAPSIIIPKSMAPIESRLADIPITRKQINANKRANGITTATITVVRQSAIKINTINVTNNIPSIRLCVTVFTARFTKSSRS